MYYSFRVLSKKIIEMKIDSKSLYGVKQAKLYLKDKKMQAAHGLFAGVDEAGVGPLAGPVIAAAVVFDFRKKMFTANSRNGWLQEINDSKKLTHEKREYLLKFVIKHALAFGIGISSVAEIDRINILQSRLIAMKRAIENLRKIPKIVFVDGNRSIPNLQIQQRLIVRGDEKVFSIAAASILAKVTRDNILKNLHKQFPQYGFDRHKGYGTQFHFEMIQKYGPSEVHRKSFAPIKSLLSR